MAVARDPVPRQPAARPPRQGSPPRSRRRSRPRPRSRSTSATGGSRSGSSPPPVRTRPAPGTSATPTSTPVPCSRRSPSSRPSTSRSSTPAGWPRRPRRAHRRGVRLHRAHGRAGAAPDAAARHVRDGDRPRRRGLGRLLRGQAEATYVLAQQGWRAVPLRPRDRLDGMAGARPQRSPRGAGRPPSGPVVRRRSGEPQPQRPRRHRRPRGRRRRDHLGRDVLLERVQHGARGVPRAALHARPRRRRDRDARALVALARRRGRRVPAAGLGDGVQHVLSGSPVPVGAWTRLVEVFSAASTSAERYAALMPAHVPGVHPRHRRGPGLPVARRPAGTLRRAPLAGLPLLTIYSVPVGMVGGGVTWWIFALGRRLPGHAVPPGERAGRALGTPLGVDPAVADPTGFGVTTGAVRHTAGTIGTIATLAVVVPLLVPTLSLQWFTDFGSGRRRLRHRHREPDDRPAPRPHPRPGHPAAHDEDQRPHPGVPADLGAEPVLRERVELRGPGRAHEQPGRRPDARPAGRGGHRGRDEFQYSVQTSSAFRSRGCPPRRSISNIVASGDWRYDFATMDFIAGDSEGDLTAADRLDYTMTGLKLQLDAEAMAKAPSSSGAVSRDYTQLPPGMPTMVHAGQRGDAGGAEPVREAVALQTWFRETGGFTYDLHTATGNGTDELVAFLTDDEDGRTGYCEQFASAMAVMARILGIPARVAVGFLVPDRIAPGTFEYSAWDLHAWPELFFPGAGWVRFEPTPAGRAQGVPGYTSQDVPVVNPTGGITNNPRSARSRAAARARARTPVSRLVRPRRPDSGTGSWWVGRWRAAPASSSSRSWRCSPGRCDARAGSSGSGAGPRRPGPSCGRPPRTSGCLAGGALAARHPAAPRALPRETRGPRHPRASPARSPVAPEAVGPWTGSSGRSSCPATPARAGRSRRAPTWRPVWRRCTVRPRARHGAAPSGGRGPWSARVPGGAPHGRAPGRGEVRRRRRPRRLTRHFRSPDDGDPSLPVPDDGDPSLPVPR